MKKATLKALQGSIKHWQRNVKAAKENRTIDLSPASCPLCILFNNHCNSCPIKEKTNLCYCIGTPYKAIDELWPDRRICRKKLYPKLVKACQAELDFLKSLLPKTK
jgi:hypothetical protein